jgi:hypothetical protein
VKTDRLEHVANINVKLWFFLPTASCLLPTADCLFRIQRKFGQS